MNIYALNYLKSCKLKTLLFSPAPLSGEFIIRGGHFFSLHIFISCPQLFLSSSHSPLVIVQKYIFKVCRHSCKWQRDVVSLRESMANVQYSPLMLEIPVANIQ